MNVYFAVDDIAPSYLESWEVLRTIKSHCPQFKVNCFVIANKDFVENVAENKEFIEWFAINKEWIQIGVHGYDHNVCLAPEVERDLWELRLCLQRSLDILHPFLPSLIGYRSPGFQTRIELNDLLQELGFHYIAHETRVQCFDGMGITPGHFINTHIYDIQPMMFSQETQFSFIGE